MKKALLAAATQKKRALLEGNNSTTDSFQPRKRIASSGELSSPKERLAAARQALAPTGVLRAGVNLANFLLVSGTKKLKKEGRPKEELIPDGVSPDLVREIARRLGVEVRYVPFESPKKLADAAEAEDEDSSAWDIGLLGHEPARASTIVFTAPYCEIPCTYLVSSYMPALQTVADVDQKDVRIGSVAGGAFDLWLERNLRKAELVRAPTMETAFELLRDGKVSALAGLRQRLSEDVTRLPAGARVLEGQFMSVQQAVGAPRSRCPAVAEAFLRNFVEDAKTSGLLAQLLEKHEVVGKLLVSAPDAAVAKEAAAAESEEAAEAPFTASRLPLPPMKVAVLGCGAMGSIYAALLASGGHEVWGVDVWQAHIDAIKERGLRVEGASGDRTVRIQATADASDVGEGDCDLRSGDLAAAAKSAAKLAKPDEGMILTIQNGLGAGDRIVQEGGVEAKRVLLGIASNFGASMKGPGHAEHKSMNLISMGEMATGSGVTARLERLVAAWSAAGFNAKACPDINKTIWEKFICNCALSSSCTLTEFTVGELMDSPPAWQTALACAREAYAVARAKGIALDFTDVEAHVTMFASTVRAARPSMAQDHMAKRRSEVDAINGAVPLEAAKVGLSAPVNQNLADLVRARENAFWV